MTSRSEFCVEEGTRSLLGVHQGFSPPWDPFWFQTLEGVSRSPPLDGNSSPAKPAGADSWGRRMESRISFPVPKCLPNPGPGSCFCSGSEELASPERPQPSAVGLPPSPVPSAPSYTPLQNTAGCQQPPKIGERWIICADAFKKIV